MRDVSLIHKELSEMTGMKTRLGQPPEDPHLQDLLSQIAEHEARLAELKRLIAELETKVGWTAEEEAERARLQSLIDEEEANVAKWQGQISNWSSKVGQAQSKVNGLIGELNDVEDRISAVKKVWDKALECAGASFSYACAEELADLALPVFPEYSSDIEGLRSGNKFIIMAIVGALMGRCKLTTDSLNSQRATLQSELASAQNDLSYCKSQLSYAQDELEKANRRLGDARAAKERYELAITRAIALRQAEVDMAKARHELELRTLDNLKATYDVLLKEIDLAKAEAIAEAARQREEVIKADESERESIAEEQRRIAEEYERLAAESVGVEREEYLEKMRRALDIAEDAEEAAIAAAKEREKLAKDIATAKAELARTELELEELRKQQAIAEERKEEIEEKIAGLPAIPKWGWIALGIGGATATAGGIAYAIKKKKKRK